MGAKSFGVLVAMLFLTSCSARAEGLDPRDPAAPLHLVRTIELPDVKGRIDHLALDPKAKHLYIAENANGSVDDVDLAAGKIVGRVTGLKEPQGVAWLPAQQEIAVASADGMLTFYRASDRQKVAALNLGADADNVRLDNRNGQLVVGYGSGGLAVVEPATHRVRHRMPLPAHPEGFEIVGNRAFVNVPNAHGIVIVNIDEGRMSSRLGLGFHFGNFPMGSDIVQSRIAVAYRAPGALSFLDARSGTPIFSVATCGDADDLYFRPAQIVVICGSGSIDLINDRPPHVRVLVATERGARTGLLDQTTGHLFVAVPARNGPAAIWELSFH